MHFLNALFYYYILKGRFLLSSFEIIVKVSLVLRIIYAFRAPYSVCKLFQLNRFYILRHSSCIAMYNTQFQKKACNIAYLFYQLLFHLHAKITMSTSTTLSLLLLSMCYSSNLFNVLVNKSVLCFNIFLNLLTFLSCNMILFFLPLSFYFLPYFFFIFRF